MSASRDDRPGSAEHAADPPPAPDDDDGQQAEAKQGPTERARPGRRKQGTADPDALEDGWEPV